MFYNKNMPQALAYESAVRNFQYEVDGAGTLHITISPIYLGKLGMETVYWVAALIFPPALLMTSMAIYHTTQLLWIILIASIVVSLFFLLLGWHEASALKIWTWIDARPDELLIRQQDGVRSTSRVYPRDKMKAIRVQRRYHSYIWDIDVHTRYDWNGIMSHLSRKGMDEIAGRLREFYQLPQKPGKEVQEHVSKPS